MSPFLSPCKKHDHEERSDGWVWCRRCNTRLFKAPEKKKR